MKSTNVLPKDIHETNIKKSPKNKVTFPLAESDFQQSRANLGNVMAAAVAPVDLQKPDD